MWEIWKKIFLEVHEKLRTKNIPWITSGIKELIKKDKLKRKAILTNLENDWLNDKTSRNEVNVNINLRNAKKITIPRK